jgi:ATP-dependent RNA helicase RhlE
MEVLSTQLEGSLRRSFDAALCTANLEGGRQGGRQGGREAGRQGGREADREGGRQGGREAGRMGSFDAPYASTATPTGITRNTHNVVQPCKSHLGLHHPKLGQVAGRIRVLHQRGVSGGSAMK